MSINEKIYSLRKNLGLTLEDVGNAVGVGKSTVRKWEKGIIANMGLDKVAALAKVLQTTPAYLMGWDEAAPALELTDKERRLVESYRNNPAMQSAVDRLLGITDTSGTAATLADDLAQEIDALQSTRHTATKQN